VDEPAGCAEATDKSLHRLQLGGRKELQALLNQSAEALLMQILPQKHLVVDLLISRCHNNKTA
jgi:hypothetical protein